MPTDLYTHHLFTHTQTDGGPFRRLSKFQSEFFGRLERIGFEVVATSILLDGTLLTTWRATVETTSSELFDLDAALAQLDARVNTEIGLSELEGALDLDVSILGQFDDDVD